MSTDKSEKASMREIMLNASATKDSRLFRNNVGRLETRDGTWVQYGLAVGSSDLIGWHSVVVTPEMVGTRVAIFTAIETKARGEKPTADQKQFLDTVRDAGGIPGVAASVADYKTILGYWLRHIGALK